MRECKKCGRTKRLEEFPPADKKGRRRHECGECYKARHHQYYVDGRKKYRQRSFEAYYKRRKIWLTTLEGIQWRRQHQKTYNAKLRQLVLDAYGHICACCHETADRFLTIDHINGDGKIQRTEHRTGISFYRWLKRKKFPSGFQTLCFNCNIGRALNGGICPHKEGSTTIPHGSTPQAIGGGSAQPLISQGEDIVCSAG